MADDPPVTTTTENSRVARLEYGPRRSRTRWVRLTLFVVIGLVIAALMPRMWTEFGYRVGRRNFQREMLTFTAPPGTLAYGEGDDARAIAAGAQPSRSDVSAQFQPEVRDRDGRSRNAPSWQAWFSLADYQSTGRRRSSCTSESAPAAIDGWWAHRFSRTTPRLPRRPQRRGSTSTWP